MEDKIVSLINSYHPSPEVIGVISRVPVLLIAGISGAGKDTIIRRLIEAGDYHRIITNTTRSPRPYEERGSHYHFIDKQTALHMLEKREFIEANYYVGNVYGTDVEEFRKAERMQKLAVADIDVNGVDNFMKMSPQTTRAVFLIPPSYDEWLARWKKRYGDAFDDHTQEITGRLQTAVGELEHALSAGYYSFVINNDLDRAVDDVDAIGKTGIQEKADRQSGIETVKGMVSDMKRALFSV